MSPRILFSALALCALAGSASAEVVVIPGTAFAGAHESAVQAKQQQEFNPPLLALENRCTVACPLAADKDRPACAPPSPVLDSQDPNGTTASKTIQVAGRYSPDVEAWAAAEGSPIGLGMTYDGSGKASSNCAPAKWQVHKK